MRTIRNSNIRKGHFMTNSEIKEAVDSMSEQDFYAIAYQCCRRIQILISDAAETCIREELTVARFCKLVSEVPSLKGKVTLQQVVLVVRVCDEVLDGRIDFMIRTTPESDLKVSRKPSRVYQKPNKKGGHNGIER